MKSLCGLRPTGRLHIGHYFSCIRPAIAGANILIATYHAPFTTKETVDSVLFTLSRFGVKNVVHQEIVFDATLYFRLLALTYPGELNRMTQFRSSDDKTAHLFVYPVLMVHDVAGYEEVIVGEDQTQHLNFARDLLARYNKTFKEYIGIPVANPIGGRVMSLTDPTSKMSKSEPSGCLFLDDTHEEASRKIRKAVTTDAGRANLYALYRELGGTEPPPELNSTLKEILTEKVCTLLTA
jgi:tryptophanyl-tRNA synthetase